MIREIHFGTLMPTLNGYSGDKKNKIWKSFKLVDSKKKTTWHLKKAQDNDKFL